MRKIWLFIPTIILLWMIFVFAVRMLDYKGNSFTQNPLIGKDVPPFSLPSLFEGKAGFSNEDLKGKYSLINIFGSWCPMCRFEHPYLFKLSKKIDIYGIDWKDDRDDALNWLSQMGNPYKKIGFDKEGVVVASLGITGAPETFIIDRQGKIVFRYPGPLTEDIIKEEIIPRINR